MKILVVTSPSPTDFNASLTSILQLILRNGPFDGGCYWLWTDFSSESFPNIEELGQLLAAPEDLAKTDNSGLHPDLLPVLKAGNRIHLVSGTETLSSLKSLPNDLRARILFNGLHENIQLWSPRGWRPSRNKTPGRAFGHISGTGNPSKADFDLLNQELHKMEKQPLSGGSGGGGVGGLKRQRPLGHKNVDFFFSPA